MDRFTGTLKNWLGLFGFIRPDDATAPDLWMGIKAWEGGDPALLVPGVKLEFSKISYEDKNRKQRIRAANVKLLPAAPIKAEAPVKATIPSAKAATVTVLPKLHSVLSSTEPVAEKDKQETLF
jgi:hypothetical protein